MELEIVDETIITINWKDACSRALSFLFFFFFRVIS